MISMNISGLSIDPFTNMPFIILRDADEKHRLPIWIGLFEASAIATELEKIKLTRPMTHDLICNLLQSLNANLKQIEIHDLKENTYFARMMLVGNNPKQPILPIDCRPSDAIAVALRLKVPIMVEESVIEKAKKIDLSMQNLSDKEKVSKEKWKEILESLSAEDFGKYKM